MSYECLCARILSAAMKERSVALEVIAEIKKIKRKEFPLCSFCTKNGTRVYFKKSKCPSYHFSREDGCYAYEYNGCWCNFTLSEVVGSCHCHDNEKIAEKVQVTLDNVLNAER